MAHSIMASVRRRGLHTRTLPHHATTIAMRHHYHHHHDGGGDPLTWVVLMWMELA